MINTEILGKLSQEGLKSLKLSIEAYKQGIVDTMNILADINDENFKKIDEKIAAIDKFIKDK